jgi:hypothetical protein
MFVSDAHDFDSVDDRILQSMIDSQAEFLMEVTDKTKADIKVHLLQACPFTLINQSSRVELLLTMKDRSVCWKSPKSLRSMSRISSLASRKPFILVLVLLTP